MIAVHPGEMLAEWQTEHNMSSVELATRLGVSPNHVSEFRNGHVGLSPRLALALERVTGIQTRLWLAMQSDYAVSLLRPKAPR